MVHSSPHSVHHTTQGSTHSRQKYCRWHWQTAVKFTSVLLWHGGGVLQKQKTAHRTACMLHSTWSCVAGAAETKFYRAIASGACLQASVRRKIGNLETTVVFVLLRQWRGALEQLLDYVCMHMLSVVVERPNKHNLNRREWFEKAWRNILK